MEMPRGQQSISQRANYLNFRIRRVYKEAQHRCEWTSTDDSRLRNVVDAPKEECGRPPSMREIREKFNSQESARMMLLFGFIEKSSTSNLAELDSGLKIATSTCKDRRADSSGWSVKESPGSWGDLSYIYISRSVQLEEQEIQIRL
jgi:hypothetical protein